MIIDGEHLFHAPRDIVYQMLQDPEVLAGALPNAQSLTKIDDEHYEAAFHIRIGPVSGMFLGKLAVVEAVPPEKCVVNLEGRAGPAFATGRLFINFSMLSETTTLLKYIGEAEAGGALANVAPRIVEQVARRFVKQAFQSLDKMLQARQKQAGLANSAQGDGSGGKSPQ